MDVTIIVDTNSYALVQYLKDYNNTLIYVHERLKHPHHLTWIHREHIENFINDFDYFMYIEDDIDLPFENFVEYLDNFKYLYPKYVPSFVRIEELDGKQYIVDMQKQQKIIDSEIIRLNGKEFISLERPYHAFWIMPAKELKGLITKDFINYCIDRELAASYIMRGLQIKPLIMLENNSISPLCYSYHLPNTYVNIVGNQHKFGRIEIGDLLIR